MVRWFPETDMKQFFETGSYMKSGFFGGFTLSAQAWEF
jgi:hypothetical protein